MLYAVREVYEPVAGSGVWQPVVPGCFQAVDFQNMIDSMVQAPPGNTPAGSNGTSTRQKTGMIDVATTRFGALTDLDSNGGLIVLFTYEVTSG